MSRAGRQYQVMTLSAMGDAETPAGGSVCMRCSTFMLAKASGKGCITVRLAPATDGMPGWRTLKSRINRRRAAVDMVV